MCAIPLSFRFSLDFVYFPSILVLSRERQLGKENTYEKINHHHPRTHYDTHYSTAKGCRSTTRERRKDGGQKCKKESHAEFPPEKRYRFRFPGVVPNRSL
jgi:hypothetical protein